MSQREHNNDTPTLKAVLTLSEAAEYSGFSRRYLLKLIGLRKLPAYKPGGKTIFLRRDELEAWLCSNRIATVSELDTEARRIGNHLEGRR